MSGIECAGVVLAVLPLVIEAAKAYKHGVDTIVDVVSNPRRDEKLEDFYEDLWWELFILDKQLRDVVHALPFLEENLKANLLKAENVEQWTRNTEVAKSLTAFFNSDSDYQTFMLIMGKIVQLLAQLVKESSSKVESKEMDQAHMYIKLKAFEEERRKKKSSTTASERIRFWRKEKDRKTCLKALRTWNKRLLCLTEEARREPVTKIPTTSVRGAPSSQLREVSRILYKALARYWSCTCDTPHEARLSLMPKGSNKVDQASTDFDFFFIASSKTDANVSLCMEGTVLMRPKNEAHKYDCAPLDRICDALRKGMTSHCLSFLVEQATDKPTVWQMRPQPKRFKTLLDSTPSISLQSVLHNSHRLPLIAKRKLAVILARSLLQLQEQLWVGEDWSKDQITFFHESTNTIDYQTPYVTTRFDRTDQASLDFSLFHRNASILALGVLLIEIHTGHPIEAYRKPEDLTNGTEVNANTDLTVANRVVKSLDDCSLVYKDAVQACLDLPWVSSAQRVSLDDELTRAGMFTYVVQPLEEELHHLFRERF